LAYFESVPNMITASILTDIRQMTALPGQILSPLTDFGKPEASRCFVSGRLPVAYRIMRNFGKPDIALHEQRVEVDVAIGKYRAIALNQ
jgi:hypothetical protein